MNLQSPASFCTLYSVLCIPVLVLRVLSGKFPRPFCLLPFAFCLLTSPCFLVLSSKFLVLSQCWFLVVHRSSFFFVFFVVSSILPFALCLLPFDFAHGFSSVVRRSSFIVHRFSFLVLESTIMNHESTIAGFILYSVLCILYSVFLFSFFVSLVVSSHGHFAFCTLPFDF
jgi:hypothetical protein